MQEQPKYLKGTTTVGIVCADGVVIAADRRATMGDYIANPNVRKVYKIDSCLGLTMAGGVGDAQDLVRILKAQNEMYKMNEGRPLSPKSASSLLSVILQQTKMYPYYVLLMIGGIDDMEPQLYTLDPYGGVTEEDKFAATGSGMEVAIGYIEDSYSKNMSTKDAVKVAAKAIAIASRRSSATGDGVIVAVITKSGYIEYTGAALEKAVSAK